MNMKWLMISAILFYRINTNMQKNEEFLQKFRIVNKYSMEFLKPPLLQYGIFIKNGHALKIAYYNPKYPQVGKTIFRELD